MTSRGGNPSSISADAMTIHEVDGIRHVICDSLTKPLPIYSHATVHNGIVYLSCIQGLIPGTLEIPSSVSDEARQVFDNVRVVLEQSGSSLSRVLKMTILMTDMSEFSQINDVVNEYFPANPPARASIAVLELPKGARVVVELIAATNALVD